MLRSLNDLPVFNLMVDVGGGPLTLFVHAGTTISADASSWEEMQVGSTVTAQYFTSTNLAVELDGEQ